MPTKPNSTLIAVVLDRSGSMESVRDATIESVNGFIDLQRKLPGEAKLTLMQFDTEFLTTCDEVPLDKVKPLTRETYVPRLGTALLDAIGITVDDIGKRLAARPEEERPSKVVVVIQTDGYENSSFMYTKQKINEMISHQRTKYAWDFIFLGANQDAIATAATFGIAPQMALTISNDSLGMQKGIYAISSAVGNSRMGLSNTYSDSVRGAATMDSMDLESFKALVDKENPATTVTVTTTEQK